jgi:predicted dehydrogenase
VLAHMQAGEDGASTEVDETTSAIVRFPGGRIAQFVASQGCASVGTCRVVGTKGDVCIEPAFDYAKPMKVSLTVKDKTRHIKVPKHDQFAAELLYFSDCVLRGKEPEPSGEEGLADVRVMQAIVRSAREGRAVRVEPLPRREGPKPSQEIDEPGIPEPEVTDAPSPSTG